MALGPWRIMPDVLLMSAFEFRNPIQIFILVKSDNFSRPALGLALRLHNALPKTGLILGSGNLQGNRNISVLTR